MLAIRPKTLPAAAGPILVGFGLACSVTGYRREMLWPSLVCFLASILLQIGVNLANDYFDFVNPGLLPPMAWARCLFLSFLAGSGLAEPILP